MKKNTLYAKSTLKWHLRDCYDLKNELLERTSEWPHPQHRETKIHHKITALKIQAIWFALRQACEIWT